MGLPVIRIGEHMTSPTAAVQALNTIYALLALIQGHMRRQDEDDQRHQHAVNDTSDARLRLVQCRDELARVTRLSAAAAEEKRQLQAKKLGLDEELAMVKEELRRLKVLELSRS